MKGKKGIASEVKSNITKLDSICFCGYTKKQLNAMSIEDLKNIMLDNKMELFKGTKGDIVNYIFNYKRGKKSKKKNFDITTFEIRVGTIEEIKESLEGVLNLTLDDSINCRKSECLIKGLRTSVDLLTGIELSKELAELKTELNYIKEDAV